MRSESLAAVLFVLALPAAAAPAYDGSNRFVSPRLDGAPVLVENAVTGQTWSAWSYSSRGELDLALSVLQSDGRWSPPVFLGQNDRVDQIDPALTVDSRGVVYLAYAERGTGRVHVAVLPNARSTWSEIAMFSSTQAAVAAPALQVVGDRLVVAFRSGRGVELRDLPLYVQNGTMGIDDGPDPFGNGHDSGNQGGGNGSTPTREWKPRK